MGFLDSWYNKSSGKPATKAEKAVPKEDLEKAAKNNPAKGTKVKNRPFNKPAAELAKDKKKKESPTKKILEKPKAAKPTEAPKAQEKPPEPAAAPAPTTAPVSTPSPTVPEAMVPGEFSADTLRQKMLKLPVTEIQDTPAAKILQVPTAGATIKTHPGVYAPAMNRVAELEENRARDLLDVWNQFPQYRAETERRIKQAIPDSRLWPKEIQPKAEEPTATDGFNLSKGKQEEPGIQKKIRDMVSAKPMDTLREEAKVFPAEKEEDRYGLAQGPATSVMGAFAPGRKSSGGTFSTDAVKDTSRESLQEAADTYGSRYSESDPKKFVYQDVNDFYGPGGQVTKVAGPEELLGSSPTKAAPPPPDWNAQLKAKLDLTAPALGKEPEPTIPTETKAPAAKPAPEAPKEDPYARYDTATGQAQKDLGTSAEQYKAAVKAANDAKFWDRIIGATGRLAAGAAGKYGIGTAKGTDVGSHYKYEPMVDSKELQDQAQTQYGIEEKETGRKLGVAQKSYDDYVKRIRAATTPSEEEGRLFQTGVVTGTPEVNEQYDVKNQMIFKQPQTGKGGEPIRIYNESASGRGTGETSMSRAGGASTASSRPEVALESAGQRPMNDPQGRPIKNGVTGDYGTSWANSVNPADRNSGAEMFNDFEDSQPPGNPKARVTNARNNADAVMNFIKGSDRNPIPLTANESDKAKFYYTNALVSRLGYNADTQNIFLYGTKTGETTELFDKVRTPPPGYDVASLRKDPAKANEVMRGLPPAVVKIMTMWMMQGKIR